LGKSRWSSGLTPYLCLVLSSKIHEAMPVLSLFNFMQWTGTVVTLSPKIIL